MMDRRGHERVELWPAELQFLAQVRDVRLQLLRIIEWLGELRERFGAGDLTGENETRQVRLALVVAELGRQIVVLKKLGEDRLTMLPRIRAPADRRGQFGDRAGFAVRQVV